MIGVAAVWFEVTHPPVLSVARTASEVEAHGELMLTSAMKLAGIGANFLIGTDNTVLRTPRCRRLIRRA